MSPNLPSSGTTEIKFVGQVVGDSIVIGTASIPADHDSGEVTYTSLTQEVYTYKKNGTVVRTVTINYTSSSKEYIADWSIA